MEQQQFCLRWHNHQSSVLGGLPALLDSGDLADVTLCAGGKSLRAHRIVLSACSPYFMDIFKDLPSAQQPVVVVLGGEWTELCCLVAFMYAGQVTLPREALPGVLRLAAALQVTGLQDLTGTDLDRLSKNKNIDRIVENLKWNRRKRDEDDNEANDNDDDDRDDEDESSTKRARPRSRTTSDSQSPCSSGAKGFATCYVCHKRLSNQYNLRVHLETHQNARHACSACEHVSRSRDALRKHVSYRHPHLNVPLAPKPPNP